MPGITYEKSEIDTKDALRLAKASNLSDLASAATSRSNLGLGTAAVGEAASAVDLRSYNLATWSDSLSAGTSNQTPWLSQITSTLVNWTVYNGGVAGESSTQIKTRMLAATDKTNWTTVIWAGTNNSNAPTTVKGDIAAMIAALGHSRYVVISVFSNYSDPSTIPGVVALNSDLATLYGARYLDIRSYLIAQANPGIPQDVTDAAAGQIPSSLRIDSVVGHPTTAAHALIATQIAAKITTVLNATKSFPAAWDMAGVFAYPPALGTTTPAAGSFTALAATSLAVVGPAAVTGSMAITPSATDLTGFLKTNAANNASTSVLNQGVLYYNSGPNAFGAHLGYFGGTYGHTLFTGPSHNIYFAKCSSAGSPTAPSDFTLLGTLDGSGNLTLTGGITVSGFAVSAGVLTVSPAAGLTGVNSNGSGLASATNLNPGFLAYSNGPNVFGTRLASYGGVFSEDVFCGTSGRVTFSKCSSAGAPTAQSDFTLLGYVDGSGNASFSGRLTGASLSATTATFGGAVTGSSSASFAGAVTGATVTSAGAIAGGALAVSTGSFSGAVTGSSTASFGGAVTAASVTTAGNISAAGTITFSNAAATHTFGNVTILGAVIEAVGGGTLKLDGGPIQGATNITASGAVTVGGNLAVTGTAAITGNLTAANFIEPIRVTVQNGKVVAAAALTPPIRVPVGCTVVSWSVASNTTHTTGTVKVWRYNSSMASPTDMTSTGTRPSLTAAKANANTSPDWASLTLSTGDYVVLEFVAGFTATDDVVFQFGLKPS